MNTILLQKILDILTEGLAHVGNFFKDLFVSDPQDGQVIGYDADAGKWKNMSVAELALDVTDTAGPDDIITFSDAADMPLKSLIANINVEGGTDEVVITRTGKNLFDKTAITNNAYISGSTGEIIPTNGFFCSDYIRVSPGVNYVTNSIATGVRIFVFYNKNKEYLGTTSSASAITPDNCEYIRINGKTSDITPEEVQLEAGTAPTSYEPYNGTSETITLPSSVSSGYVDVISGKGMSGDTPFTITPVIIKSTTGINNIFADTGDVSAVYYTKAAGDIKNLVSITEDITSEITKNTTDFSDILLKVSQNNKVVSIEIYNATTAEAVNDTFLSNLPKPAMNCPVMFINKTVGEDGIFYGSLSTSGALNITVPGAKSFGGLITYVAK